MNSTKYAYPVGRIRALETKLLTPDTILRMVDAPDFEGAYRVLEETDYSQHLAQVAGIYEFRKVLDLELVKIKSILQEIAPDWRLIAPLFLKYDFHNIKVLLKAKYLGVDTPELLINLGNYELEKLKNFILNGVRNGLPQEILDGINEGAKVFEKDKDPQVIDIILDKYYYSLLKTKADLKAISYFSHLVEMWIDLTNLKTLLRLKALKRTEDFFSQVLIPRGTIDKTFWIKLFAGSLEEIPKALKFTHYSKIIDEGVVFYLKNNSLSLLEKLIANHLMDWTRKAKFIALGAEPLMGYMLAKESEVGNLRTILVLKMGAVPIPAIKERLCEIYV